MTPQLSIEENALRIHHVKQRHSAYPSYANSGPQWLPHIPNGWSIQRLKFLIRFPAKSEIRSLPLTHSVSFVPMEAVGEYGGLRLGEMRPLEAVMSGYTYFRNGDVVVAKITPCFENGKGALADGLENGIGFGTTELHVLRASDKLLPKFLFYLTISRDFRELGTAEMYGAGGQKRVPESFIRDLQHPIPPVAEQAVIIGFLDQETLRIDQLIAEKQRLIELLDEWRSAFITHAVTRGIDPKVKTKPSNIDWLGEIPQHWAAMRLRHLVHRIEQGWSPDADNREANVNEWAVMRAGCANGGTFDENDHKALPAEVEPDPRLEIRKGDLLMSRACGSKELVGSVALVGQCRRRLLLCDKLYRLHYRTDKIHAGYLQAALNSHLIRMQLIRDLSGAEGLARNIAQSAVKELVLCVPPLEEQRRIDASIGQERSRISRLSERILFAVNQLHEYRSTLITAAMTGQIDVRQHRGDA